MPNEQLIEIKEGFPPKSLVFDDFYYSKESGEQETDYVFLQHNFLFERFNKLKPDNIFTVYETGFGTGLNFLKTVEVFLRVSPNQARLAFISFEKFPLTVDQIKKSLAIFPKLEPLVTELLLYYPILTPGWHQVEFFDHRVTLIVWIGDVLEGLPEFTQKADAWFLDGFAPAKNPEMWRPELFGNMARLSHSQTTFATFTSAGVVRRGLAAAGFKVHKVKGFGAKREMCCGHFEHERQFSSKTPWYDLPKKAVSGHSKKACVIGAGLAGATVACQLAKQGWQVMVLESEKEVASKASGNLAGAIHPLITADWNIRSQFYMRGFEASLAWLTPWLEAGGIQGDLSGLSQYIVDQAIHHRIYEGIERASLPENFVHWRSNCESDKSTNNHVFFPKGGWVYPKSVIEKCLSHDNIKVQTGCKINELNRKENKWQLISDSQQVFEVDVAVVATGALEEKLNQILGLPIRPVKGQVTHLKPESLNYKLDSVMTHRGYTVSWLDESDNQLHAVTGATFEAPDMSSTLSQDSHCENLSMIKEVLPDWLNIDCSASMEGRVSFRPTTPDHLPIIGAVADAEWYEKNYYRQSHTQANYRYKSSCYLPGLYVSNGHGARGLMSVFLAAEIIGFMVDGKSSCIPQKMIQACHPERFKVREWRRGKNN